MDRIEGWCGEWLAAQRGLLLPWLAVSMGAGVGVYFSLRAEPAADVTAGVCGGMLAVWMGAGWLKSRSSVGAIGFYACVLLCGMAAGFALAQLRTHGVASPMLDRAVKRAGVIGDVRSVELLEPGKGYRLILGRLDVQDLAKDKTPAFIRLRVRGEPEMRVGQRIYVEAGLNPPAAPVAPGAFDFQFYAWFRRIGAFGFAYTKPEILSAAPAPGYWAEKARQAIGSRVGRSLSGREAAMSVAMMNGEVTGVSADDWNAMRNAGLAHILAISGSHVTVLAGFVFFAIRLLLAFWPYAAVHWPIKKFAAMAAMVAASFYVYMVGPLIPIMRAYLMTDLILLAVLVERVPISLNLLAFSAMAVMAWMPEQALGPSFQMSYAAVAALILVYEYTKGLVAGGVCGGRMAAQDGAVPARHSGHLAGGDLGDVAAIALSLPAVHDLRPGRQHDHGADPVVRRHAGRIAGVPRHAVRAGGLAGAVPRLRRPADPRYGALGRRLEACGNFSTADPGDIGTAVIPRSRDGAVPARKGTMAGRGIDGRVLSDSLVVPAAGCADFIVGQAGGGAAGGWEPDDLEPGRRPFRRPAMDAAGRSAGRDRGEVAGRYDAGRFPMRRNMPVAAR